MLHHFQQTDYPSLKSDENLIQIEMEGRLKQREDQLAAAKKEVDWLKEQMQATQEYSM